MNDQNILGFTDAEGSFSFSIYSYNNQNIPTQTTHSIINSEKLTLDTKKNVNFVFKITQTGSEVKFLNKLVDFFGCGKVFLTQNKDSSSELFKGYYTVNRREDLINIILPFFNKNELQTIKKYSFERFSRAILIANNKEIDNISKIKLIEKIALETENKRP